MPRVRRRWSATDPATAEALVPRDDVLLEAPDGDGTFRQADGPFREYRRTLTTEPDGRVAQTTRYSITIPWFRWLFGPLVRWSMKHRPESGRQPWWAPPDRLNQRQTLVLGLLAAASMCSAYVNTLFSQTVSFAADEFGVGTGGQGVAGTFVRAGIVFMLPVAFLADRAGRRRVIRFVIFAAPIVASLGAFAPNFAVLTATQTLGRPLGLALDLLITVVAAEEMPRNSRAYAVSLMAMAQGLGSGVCVMSLRLADSGPGGWRTIYLITLVFLLVAFDVSRRLPETERFQAHVDHQAPPGGIQRGRLLVQCAAAFFLNMFLAPASFFQNRYLDDVRGYSGGGVALFTVSTATPAALGIVVGGKLADKVGRRPLGAVCTVVGTVFLALSYARSGAAMWVCTGTGGFILGMAVPALAVYRSEVFPTGGRGVAAYIVTASALLGGAAAILVTGQLIDGGHTYGSVMGWLAVSQVLVALIVVFGFPETAHRSLEELNPIDRFSDSSEFA